MDSGAGIVAAVTTGVYYTTSNSSGAYTITGVPNGTYTVRAVKTGYTFIPPQRTLTINGANVSGVNFQHERPLSPVSSKLDPQGIPGTATLSSGQLASINMDAGVVSTMTDTDASAGFATTSLVAGSETVRPSKREFAFLAPNRSVTFRSARVAAQLLVATQFPHSFSGGVAESGSAVPGLAVTAGSQTVTPDGAGEHVIVAAPPGACTATAVKAGQTHASASRILTVGPDQASQDFGASRPSL
jgi:hypothetical protein